MPLVLLVDEIVNNDPAIRGSFSYTVAPWSRLGMSRCVCRTLRDESHR